jgi:exonuclease VII small subunit
MDRLEELMTALQQVEADLEHGMTQWEEMGRRLEEYDGAAWAAS